MAFIVGALSKIFGGEDSQGSLDAAPTSSDHDPPTSTRKRPRSSSEHATHVTTRNSSLRAFMKNSDSSSAQKNTNQLTGSRRFQRQPGPRAPTPATEVIYDSDDDERPAKRSKKSTPTRGLNQLTDRRRTVDRPSTEESREEARLLGGHSSREADEVTIDEPVSNQTMVLKKPQLGGGFRPQSTLNKPKQISNSTRSLYFDQKVRPSTVKAVSDESTTGSNGRVKRDNTPNKRRKLDISATNHALRNTAKAAQSSSPARPSASGLTQDDAISLDDSQPPHQHDNPNQKTPHRLRDGHVRQRKADSSPQRSLAPLTNPTNGTSLGLTRSRADSRAQPSVHDSGNSVGGASATMLNDSATGEDDSVVFSGPHPHPRRSSREASVEVQTVATTEANRTSHRRPASRGTDEHASPHTRSKHLNVPPESPDELLAEDDDALHLKPPRSLQRDMDNLTPNHNRRLADIITGNSDSTKLSKHKRARKSASEHGLQTFRVKDIVALGIVRKQDYYELRIESNGDLCILPHDSQLVDDEPMLTPRRASDIYQIDWSPGHSDLVNLHFRSDARTNNPKARYTLRLPSEKAAYDLATAVQTFDGNMNVRTEDAERMERSLAKFEKQIKDTPESSLRPNHVVQEANDISRHFTPATNAKRRLLLKDKLDAPENGDDKGNRTVITGRERRGAKSASPGAPGLPEDSAQATRSDSTVRPSENSPDIFTERSMRSRAQRSSRAAQVYTLKTPPPRVKFSQTGGLGDPWQNPLLYPPDQKKKESVDWGSLERLDDDEFLNDTLVGFFLRYVHYQVEKTKPDLIKKMHFFNSYFFDSLTRNVKNRKEINYESVAKWTKNINLFQRDYVVVPINEHLHWFLVIICNLSHFVPKPEDEGGDTEDLDERPLPATDGPGSDQAEHDTRQSFEELSIQDVDLSAARNANSPMKTGKKGNKKKRPSLQKYDTKTPIVISLDSLGQARSGTCGYLKQYIVQEAKAKLKIDIDEKDIRAMTAKEIPTQGNFSDCGLYVCMYLEQFMRNPNRFIQAILQREPFPWPRSIQSDELRSRLRNLIMELHRKQEKEESKGSIPELGRIMIDMRETKVEPEPEVKVIEAAPSTPPHIHESRQRLESRMKVKEKIDTPLKATNDIPRERRTGDSSGVKRRPKELVPPPIEHEAITIDDDPEPTEVRTATLPEQDNLNLSNHSSPQQLANNLRKARKDQAEEQNTRESSANSVSTDFLHQGGNFKSRQAEDDTGTLTAAAAATNGEQIETVQQTDTVVDSQDSAEIPETQQDAGDEPLPEVELQGGSQSRAAEDEIIV